MFATRSGVQLLPGGRRSRRRPVLSHRSRAGSSKGVTVIEISLLGRVAVIVGGEPLTGEAAQRRRLALLSLLCTPPLKPVSRDRLMLHLWPENDGDSARHLLSASLHVLRKALGAEAIIATGDQIELNAAMVRVDVVEFEDAVRRGDFEQAVALYGGPFLDGLFITSSADFEQWVDARREEVARLYVSALEHCARECTARGEVDAAVDAWRRLAALDPYSARTTLGLMNALVSAGNRAGALQAARVHEQLLEAEFGARPEPEVLRLADQLRQEPALPASAAEPIAGSAVEAITATAAAPTGAPPADSPDPPAAVTRTTPASEPTAPVPADPPVMTRPLRPRWSGGRTPIAAGMLVIGLFVVAGSTTLWLRSSAVSDAAPRVIAVVPLASRGGDGADDYIAAGIAWHIIDELGRIPQLRMVNSASSFIYRDSARDARSIGQRLGADALITVSARTAGDDLRVAVELVRTADGLRRWGSQYQGRRDAIFAMEEAIASSVSAALSVPQPAARPGRAIASGEVHELYLRGRHAWSQRTPASLLEALALFSQVVELDPGYAWGHVGLADAYNMLGSYDYGVMAPDSAYPRARLAAERALALVPDFEPAHAALANVRMNYEWDWTGAEKSYRRAIELNPGYTPSSEWLAGLLIARRRLPEAHVLLQQAAEYNPASPLVFTGLAHYHYYAREYSAALRHLDRALELDVAFGRAHVLRGLVLCSMGRTAEAIEVFEPLAAAYRDSDPLVVGLLGHVYAIAGRREEALAQAAWLAAQSQSRYLPAEYEVLVHLGLGNVDRVFELLEVARAHRSGGLVYLQVEPLLDPLRQLPRFQQLVTRVHGAPGGDAR